MAKLEGVKTLDMVNGEITKVAYGGAEYERVEGEAQKGDLVLIKDGWSFATQGKFYVSVGIDEDGDAQIIDNDGDTISNDRSTYDLFRKVAASTSPSVEERVAKVEGEIESLKSDVASLKGVAAPKPERLKVGDYAKVVQEGHRQNGEIIILRDSGSEWSDAFPFRSERLDGTTGDIFGHRNLVRATDEEVAEAKRAAAERKKWAQIGREVGDYKEGDIVNNVGSAKCGLGEIVGNDCGDFWVNYSDPTYRICLEASDIIELVTPVEARFDR